MKLFAFSFFSVLVSRVRVIEVHKSQSCIVYNRVKMVLLFNVRLVCTILYVCALLLFLLRPRGQSAVDGHEQGG